MRSKFPGPHGEHKTVRSRFKMFIKMFKCEDEDRSHATFTVEARKKLHWRGASQEVGMVSLG